MRKFGQVLAVGTLVCGIAVAAEIASAAPPPTTTLTEQSDPTPEAEPVLASCAAGAPTASPEQIAAFRADPVTFVETAALTDQDLSRIIGNLIIQDPTLMVSQDPAIDSPIALLMKTVSSQKYALARGLGLASVACVERQPDVALKIQEIAALSPDTTFQEAFLVAIDDIKTAALGATGGAGGGDIGSGGDVGGGTGQGGVKQGDFIFPSPTGSSSSGTISVAQTRSTNEIVSPTQIGGF